MMLTLSTCFRPNLSARYPEKNPPTSMPIRLNEARLPVAMRPNSISAEICGMVKETIMKSKPSNTMAKPTKIRILMENLRPPGCSRISETYTFRTSISPFPCS